jgi:hypothetical protein
VLTPAMSSSSSGGGHPRSSHRTHAGLWHSPLDHPLLHHSRPCHPLPCRCLNPALAAAAAAEAPPVGCRPARTARHAGYDCDGAARSRAASQPIQQAALHWRPLRHACTHAQVCRSAPAGQPGRHPAATPVKALQPEPQLPQKLQPPLRDSGRCRTPCNAAHQLAVAARQPGSRAAASQA